MSGVRLDSNDRERLPIGFSMLTQFRKRLQDPEETCCYLLDGSCEGANDSDTFKNFCDAGDFAYQECEVYKVSSANGGPCNSCEHFVDKNADTVVMSAEDVVACNSCRGSGDLSVQDVLNGGGELGDYAGLRGVRSSFKRHPDDIRAL